jgi:hypothetical protein
MKALLLTVPVLVASLVVPAQAEDKVIKTKLITKAMSEGAGGGWNCFGVTVQADGTIGSKDFFFKDLDKKGTFAGLSTYTFPDGAITASFTGEDYGKGRNKGSYVILSGSGAYEGAKGTGGFDGVGSEENPVKGIGVYDVTLNITIPSRNN